MAAQISPEEREMMKDAYCYLAQYIDPPASGTDEAVKWWESAARDVSLLVGDKWNNHPLIMLGIYSYLDHKAKEATARAQGV